MPISTLPFVKPDGTVPSGPEIYDGIMGGIEPELLNANIPLLEQKHKDESPEDRKARQERYKKAYAKYDEIYAEWHAGLNVYVAEQRRISLKSAEARNRSEEEKMMQNLEHQIHS